MPDRPAEAIMEKLSRVRLAAFDVDGTYTDGLLFYDSDGEVIKGFSAKDGLGLELLRRAGIPRGFITGRHDRATEARATYLRADFFLPSVGDKSVALENLAAERGITVGECLFMGDDLNDLTGLKAAGVAVATADASALIVPHVDYVTAAPGGKGAVREVCELILAARGLDPVEVWMTDRERSVGMQ